MIRRFAHVAIAASLAACPLVAAAEQSLEAMRSAAVAWLVKNRTLPGARMVAEADPLDSRLRLARGVPGRRTAVRRRHDVPDHDEA